MYVCIVSGDGLWVMWCVVGDAQYVLLLLRNRKTKPQVIKDLHDFLGTATVPFVEWTWKYLATLQPTPRVGDKRPSAAVTPTTAPTTSSRTAVL